MKCFQTDKLTVKVFPTRKEMGSCAAQEICQAIRNLLAQTEEINMIFAAAPSQNEVLDALVHAEGIDWSRIRAFHMDEYIGLSKDAPQGFGNFLRRHLFDLVPFRCVNYIDIAATDAAAECARYAQLLAQYPADIVVMGIGENGHIAFNDPPVADFRDPAAVKVVQLDATCRNQQVHDGCFAKLEDVPTHAVTLTVPTLVAAPQLFCIVPAKSKAAAVRETLQGSIDEHCPASILRTRDHAVLYLDADSASQIEGMVKE